MDTFCFVGRGNTVLYFVCLFDRKISESTLVISEGHSGRFCYLSTRRVGPPGWGQREARKIEKDRERTEQNQRGGGGSFFWPGLTKEDVKRKKKAKDPERRKKGVGWEVEGVKVLYSLEIQRSNQRPLTWQYLWQIITASLHMTQSARQIVFWWAIDPLVYHSNHPLMTSSTCSLH